jgi:hypothetical protein
MNATNAANNTSVIGSSSASTGGISILITKTVETIGEDTSDAAPSTGLSTTVTVAIIVVVILAVVMTSCALFVLYRLVLTNKATKGSRRSTLSNQKSNGSEKSGFKWLRILDSFVEGSTSTTPVQDLKDPGLSVVPTASMETAQPADPKKLPKDKKYHYFLSHKKVHSKLGQMPEQMAMALHDSMNYHGFRGFFDVDNLKSITKEDLEESVKKSSALLVVLHDETCDSPWCRFEWEVAEKYDIPVLVIADLDHFSKKIMLDQVVATNPYLLHNQWIDYLDSHRSQVHVTIAEWIDEQLFLDAQGHVQTTKTIAHRVSSMQTACKSQPVMPEEDYYCT